MDSAHVRAQMERLARSGGIQPRGIEILRYLVNETLAGRENDLSQKSVAFAVYLPGRDAFSSDEEKNALNNTAVQKSRLASALSNFNDREGIADPVVVNLSKGYRVAITHNPRYDPVAHALYLQAQELISRRSPVTLRRGIRLIDQALQRLPGRSDYLGLKAGALASLAMFGGKPLPTLTHAYEVAQAAMAVEYPHWRAQLAMGVIKLMLHLDWEGATAALNEAIETNPDVQSTPWYLTYLFICNRAPEALAIIRESENEWSYSNPTFRLDLGLAELLSGNAEGALHVLTPGRKDNFYLLPIVRAMAYEALDRAEDARAEILSMKLSVLQRPASWGWRAFTAGLAGDISAARKELRSLMRLSRFTYIPGTQFALAYLGVGDVEAAVASLHQSLDERDPAVLVVWPFCRRLAHLPEYDRLLARIGRPYQRH